MTYENCRVHAINGEPGLCGVLNKCMSHSQFTTDIAHSTDPNYPVRMSKEQLERIADNYDRLGCAEIDAIRQEIAAAFP